MTKQCAYCGSDHPDTRDHVPPKCLFLHPLPKKMITVPSCKRCQGSSKDDEYFLVGVFIAADGMASSGFARLSDADKELIERKRKDVMRLLGRPGFGGLVSRIASQTTQSPLVTAGNLLLPNRTLDLFWQRRTGLLTWLSASFGESSFTRKATVFLITLK